MPVTAESTIAAEPQRTQRWDHHAGCQERSAPMTANDIAVSTTKIAITDRR